MMQFIWPLDDHILTRDFYYQSSSYVAGQHGACDYIRRTGVSRASRIRAVAAGRVYNVTYDEIHGHYVALDHEGDFRSVYRHLIRRSGLTVGASVVQGQVIGNVGNTGWSQGDHLHFDLWNRNNIRDDAAIFYKNGWYAVDPELYLGKEDDDMALTAEQNAMLQTIHHFAKLEAPQKLRNLQDSINALRREVASLGASPSGSHKH